MVELRKAQKSSKGKIKINMSDDDSRAVTPVSDSEASENMSENISRSSLPSVPSEDDASSDKTAVSNKYISLEFLHHFHPFLSNNFHTSYLNEAGLYSSRLPRLLEV